MQYLDLLILPTTRCNLRCKYCYVDKEQSRHQSDLSLDDIKTLYGWIKTYSSILNINKIKIQWFGGEPLMFGANYIAQCLEMQKEFFPDSEYKMINSMQTNLTLINDEVIELFKKYFFSRVSGSFDYGSNWRTFPDGSSSTPVVEKVIKKLHENNIKVGIVCTLTRQNFHLVHEMYQYFKRNCINFRINRAGYYNAASSQSDYISLDEYNQAMIMLFDEYISDPDPTIEFYNFTLLSEIFLTEEPFFCTNPACPEFTLGFEAQGRIMSRCRYLQAIGNYLTEEPKDFLERLRKDFIHPRKRPGKCKDCEYWDSLCFGSCIGEENLDCFHSDCGYRTEVSYPLWKYIEKYMNDRGFVRGQFKKS